MIGLRQAGRRGVRCIAALTPCALFVTLVASGVALVPAASAGSAPLVLGCLVVLATSLGSLAAWVLISDRRAGSPTTGPEGTQTRADAQWAEFERAFWAYVEERSDGARWRV